MSQELNCEYAVELALQKNIHWLLHIDSDELFFMPPGTQTVKQHYEELTRERITVRPTYLRKNIRLHRR